LKKKHDVLNAYKEQFLKGAIESNQLTKEYAEKLWEELVGFADYCLSGNTKIKTNLGVLTILEIKELLLKGKEIYVYDRDSKLSKVVNYFNKGFKDVYEFTFENEQSITCTDDHKILTKNFDLVEINKVYIENMYIFGKE
jgi:DNA polymerase-3 subunit alpha